MKLAAGGRAYANFPVVLDLEASVTSFLINARRAVTEICTIPSAFWTFKRQHSTFDYLAKELEGTLGVEHPMTDYVSKNAAGGRRIVELRNGQEHAATTAGPKTIIRNFEQLPTNRLRAPTIALGEEEPVDLCSELEAITQFLVVVAEQVFAGAMSCTLPEWPPFVVAEVEAPDPLCPIRYRLQGDFSRLPTPPKMPTSS